MKKLLIVSNWKLHGNRNIILNTLAKLTNRFTNKLPATYHIAIAPPLVYLDTVRNYLIHNKHKHIYLCAQNVDIHLHGSFTGEISASMLQDLQVKYAIIGHSERRLLHNEDDKYISKKFAILKETGLIPILCIGENKIEHDSNTTHKVCINQIDNIIKSVGIHAFKNSIIAYEPIWAIGTGISASSEQVQSIHKRIRCHIAQYDSYIAKQILIQYGGSVNENNVTQFLSQPDIDGVLIGSGSLDINKFSIILQLIEEFIDTQNRTS